MEGVEGEQKDAAGDADVGNVENTRAERTDTDVDEVDDSPLVQQAIDEIANSSAEHKTPCEQRECWQV